MDGMAHLVLLILKAYLAIVFKVALPKQHPCRQQAKPVHGCNAAQQKLVEIGMAGSMEASFVRSHS